MSAAPSPSKLPLSQVIEPVVSQSLMPAKLTHVSDEELERIVLRDRNGQVRVRVFSRPNTIIAVTLMALAALTLYTMISLNYGKVVFGVALTNAATDFWKMMTQPSIEAHFTFGAIVEGVVVSLALAILTTFIGAAIAFVLGLFAAANLSNRAISNFIKSAMSFFRAVPTILWVLVFTVAIGLGPEAAVCGLLFHSIAYLVKAYSECFEEIDRAVIEALRASGATWWQTVFQAVIPETQSELLSWTFIRFEINFVNAVAVGAVAGAGGVGYQLYMAGSFYHNIHEVGFIVYACLIVAAVLEIVATQLRKRYIG